METARRYRDKIIYSIGTMMLLKSSLNTAFRNDGFKCTVEGNGRKRVSKHYAEHGITKLDVIAAFDLGNQTGHETEMRKHGHEVADDILPTWS